MPSDTLDVVKWSRLTGPAMRTVKDSCSMHKESDHMLPVAPTLNGLPNNPHGNPLTHHALQSAGHGNPLRTNNGGQLRHTACSNCTTELPILQRQLQSSQALATFGGRGVQCSFIKYVMLQCVAGCMCNRINTCTVCLQSLPATV